MKRKTGAGTIAALILTLVFGATLLISLATGATVYRHVADRVEEGSRQRVGLTYVTAKIRGADEAGMVSVGKFGDVDAVYLYSDEGGDLYETVIYVYGGKLMELYCEEDAGFTPADGDAITEAQKMTVSSPRDGLIRLTYTDSEGITETADVFLRSGI